MLSGFWMIIDESMCAWRPRTSPTGKLPNISFIFRKPENLGMCSAFLFFFQKKIGSNVAFGSLFIAEGEKC